MNKEAATVGAVMVVLSKELMMQNPERDIEDVVRGLVEKPTVEHQAAVLHKYFIEDVEFYHMYQMAELMVNYQSAEFQKIVYDKHAYVLTLRMSVYIRPLGFMPLMALKFLTLLELEDHQNEDGEVGQCAAGFFRAVALLTTIPIFGRIYDSVIIRTVIGSLQAATFYALKTKVPYALQEFFRRREF